MLENIADTVVVNRELVVYENSVLFINTDKSLIWLLIMNQKQSTTLWLGARQKDYRFKRAIYYMLTHLQIEKWNQKL